MDKMSRIIILLYISQNFKWLAVTALIKCLVWVKNFKIYTVFYSNIIFHMKFPEASDLNFKKLFFVKFNKIYVYLEGSALGKVINHLFSNHS